MAQFRDTWPALAPEWLTTGFAEKYMYTLELQRDILLDKMNQAIKIRWPGQGDASQLPYLAHDRQIFQGPNEPVDQFIQRLSAAFDSWGRAGSRVSVLEQLQAYLLGTYPNGTKQLPQAAIVGGSYPTVTQWDVIDVNTPSIALDGGFPAKTTVMPSNFNWDGGSQPWRNWLILYMTQVPTGQSGAAAATGAADASACFTDPGQNVGGVWVPATSGTPVNSPWLHITGLTGMGPQNVGEWIQLTGSSHPENVGLFPIVQVVSGTEVIVANPSGVPGDAGPLGWTIVEYPYIGPGPVWGAPGIVFGQGQLTPPPLDTGSNVGGVWQPTLVGMTGTLSWGLTCSSDVIQSIRSILGGPGEGWKSAGTWYVRIIVAFDGGDGTAGNAYSPLSSAGAGNPDGTFGSAGSNVGGVWVPTSLISSTFDAYCQGTALGYYQT